MSTNTMRCVAYTCGDTGREAVKTYIDSQGWICLPDTYADSEFSTERPALKRLLNDIKTVGIDCVVLYKLNCLSKSLTELARIVGLFEENNIRLVSTKQMDRATLNILKSFIKFKQEMNVTECIGSKSVV